MEVVAGETWSRRFCRNKAVCYSEDRERTIRSMKQNLTAAMSKVFKWLHCPLDAMLLCVRWYVAYPLSLRHVEEMMAERVVLLWTIRPFIAGRSNCCRYLKKRSGGANARWAEAGEWTRHTFESGAVAISLPGRRRSRQHG
ncbi:hypothetical protein JOE11_002014 [Robbsia andropogonis]